MQERPGDARVAFDHSSHSTDLPAEGCPKHVAGYEKQFSYALTPAVAQANSGPNCSV